MESNKFICRGISVENNEFVYGYYVSDKNEHYLINSKSHFLADSSENDYITNITEIIQEPDRLYKEVNGIKLFENDEIQYTVKGFNLTRDCIATEIIDSTCELEIDLVASIKSGEIADLEIIGNTHFNNNLTGE